MLRGNLRGPFLTGVSLKGHPYTDDTWYVSKIPALMESHYNCPSPGPRAALADAESMLTEPHVARITICRSMHKEKKLEPRFMSSSEVEVLRRWYEAKASELRQEDPHFDLKVAQRAGEHEIRGDIQEVQVAASAGLQQRRMWKQTTLQP